MKHALRSTTALGLALAGCLALAGPASAHPVQGNSWWSDGATSQYVFEGMTVSAYATGAQPGTAYYLTSGQGESVCENGTKLNPDARFPTSRGLIGLTSGVVTQEGTWHVAFCAGTTRTQSVSLTVDSTTH